MNKGKSIDVFQSVGLAWGINAQKVGDLAASFIASKGRQVPQSKVIEFLMICNEYGLNPATKEVAAFFDPDKGLTAFVMIDGWVKLANQHPECNGWTFEEKMNEAGDVVAVRCLMRRKDRTEPIITPWLHINEWKIDTSPQWRSKPSWMLSMKALKHACRLAFGFAGLYDNEEAEEIHSVDVQTVGAETTVYTKAEAEQTQPRKSREIAASIKTESEGVEDGVVPSEEPVAPTGSDASPEDETEGGAVPAQPADESESSTGASLSVEFGERLGILLDEAGCNNVAAARTIGMPVAELREVLAGEREPLSLEQIEALGKRKENPVLIRSLVEMIGA